MDDAIARRADSLYTPRFFRIFAAVSFFMTGVALQFHFGQFVAFLGYGVDTLGHILSAGVIGALLVRLQLGRWIDRFGGRRVWLVGTAVNALAVGSMQFAHGLLPLIACRMVSTISIAAVMTTAAVFAAQLAPPNRRTESLGIMGLGGFFGMAIGPTLGDWIFSGDVTSITPYRTFFLGSAFCSIIAGVLVIPTSASVDPDPAMGLRKAAPLQAGERGPILRTVRQHWPGTILLVGVVFAMVFCLQASFLERLAEKRGFRDIKLFFLIYCPTAIALRLLCRRLPEHLGRTRTVVGGLVLQALGVSALIGITSEVHLILPAIVMGAGHSFVFPSMVDLAAERLPYIHRGIGTSMILGAGDVGNIVGFFLMGEVIRRFGFDVCLSGLACTLLGGAILFAYRHRTALWRRDRDTGPTEAEPCSATRHIRESRTTALQRASLGDCGTVRSPNQSENAPLDPINYEFDSAR